MPPSSRTSPSAAREVVVTASVPATDWVSATYPFDVDQGRQGCRELAGVGVARA